MVVSTNKRGEKKLKPEPIMHYNKFMSGIDRQDQMQSYYPFSRKTVRWYKKIGIHVIQMLLMNSFYLYNKFNVGSNMPLYDFRLSVLSVLLPKLPRPRSLSLKESHFPIKYEVGKNGRAIRKRCQLCYAAKTRKDTAYYCGICPEKPSLCLEPCFKNNHSK